jgi:hypothetical protein
MSGAIAFPFKITGASEVATVPYGSDAEVEQAIAVLVLTRLGERPMEPDFGTPDPMMGEITASDIQVGLDSYGPDDIVIASVTSSPSPHNENTSIAHVDWHREEVPNG